jgi:hypothetical protein
MNRRTLTAAVTLILGTGAGEAPAQGPAPAGEGRCFELRTYTAAPGKLDALNARFRNHTVGFFRKHGMEVVGFWVPTDKEGGAGEKLIYLLSHKSRAAADASWRAFRADQDWLAARKASEVEGPLTAKVESVFLAATDYSPMK